MSDAKKIEIEWTRDVKKVKIEWIHDAKKGKIESKNEEKWLKSTSEIAKNCQNKKVLFIKI